MSEKRERKPQPAAAAQSAGSSAAAFPQTKGVGLPVLETQISRLAEDLGRLVARSEMRPRRGYSLPELLIGAFVVALIIYALAHFLILPPR